MTASFITKHWPKDLSKDWPIFLFALFFVCLKVPVLDVPLWWDEMIYLNIRFIDQGLALLMPGAYSDTVFFGHPPLYPIQVLALGALIPNPLIAGHVAGILNSLLFIFAAYSFIKEVFNRQSAFLTVGIFFTYAHIFAQSSQILPNMLMLGLGILSMRGYLQHNLVKYAIFATLAVMTRESALAFCLYPVLDSVIKLRQKDISWKQLGLVLFPVFVLGLFFLYNKIVIGSLIANPVVARRLENDQWNLQVIMDRFHATNWGFKTASTDLVKDFWFLPLGAFIWLLIKKKNSIFKEKPKVFLSLAIPALAFTSFYFFYADTVPRDFYYVTFAFSLSLSLLFTAFLKGPLLTLFCLLTVAGFNMDTHFSDIGAHNSIESYLLRTSHLKRVGSYIESRYQGVDAITISWPGSAFFKDPRFGYVSKTYEIPVFSEPKGKVMVLSDVTIPWQLERPPELENWKLKKIIVDRHLKSKIYEKIIKEGSDQKSLTE